MTVRDDNDGLEQVVRQVDGINSVDIRMDGSLEINTIPGEDPRPEVARAVVNEGYDLLELAPVGMSLEDIFLQLTREEPAPPEIVERLDEEMVDSEESI